MEEVEEGHLAEEGPGQGDAVGGTMTGVGRAWLRGVRKSLEAGEEKSCADDAGLSDTPRVLMSRLSLSLTVPL